MDGSVETPLGTMWIEDGVLFHRIETTVVEPAAAAEIRTVVATLTGGAVVPSVIDIRKVAFAAREARMMFAESPENSLESATALVVDHGSSNTMGKVFVRIDKPARPVEIFTSMEEATEWAKGFRDT